MCVDLRSLFLDARLGVQNGTLWLFDVALFW